MPLRTDFEVVRMPWLPEARPHPLWYQQPAVSAVPRIEVCIQRKALSIRRRVGASGDALDGPFPPKPPKMRWATYERPQAVDAALRINGSSARLRPRAPQ